MYLVRFLANFAGFRVFLWISRDFADLKFAAPRPREISEALTCNFKLNSHCSFNFELTWMYNFIPNCTPLNSVIIINYWLEIKRHNCYLDSGRYMNITYIYTVYISIMHSRLSVIASFSACFLTGLHAFWEPSTHCWLNNNKTF